MNYRNQLYGVSEKTTIEIAKETRTRFRVWKAERDMTYDEAINYLLDNQENDNE